MDSVVVSRLVVSVETVVGESVEEESAVVEGCCASVGIAVVDVGSEVTDSSVVDVSETTTVVGEAVTEADSVVDVGCASVGSLVAAVGSLVASVGSLVPAVGSPVATEVGAAEGAALSSSWSGVSVVVVGLGVCTERALQTLLRSVPEFVRLVSSSVFNHNLLFEASAL